MKNSSNEPTIYTPKKNIVDDAGIEYPNEVRELILNNVDSLSTVDSRHVASTYTLREYFSEMGLHRYRVKVELAHFITMAQSGDFEEVPELTEDQIFNLYQLIENFDKEEAMKVVEYDHFGRNGKGATEHDVKSVEYYIGEKLDELGLSEYKSFIHIYCTSEDINNIAYHSMLRDAMNNIMLPKLRGIIGNFSQLADKFKKSPMMGRTHGQPASPTTFGKEIAVFNDRLVNNLKRLEELTLNVKFNGAVGNYNSHKLAKPNINWESYSEKLANSFGFDISYLTNQRGPMTENVALFQVIQNLNKTLQDFCTDIWLYNADGNVYHNKVKDEVGSSVMPQKVNPWFLEEAEGFLKMANDMFDTFVKNNDISRRQRDMTGHPQERNYGDAMGQTLTAWTNILESLSRIDFDVLFNEQQLENHPEVVTEGIQTILRREGEDNAYEILKAIVRGKTTTLQTLYDFISYLGESIDNKGHYAFFEDLSEDMQELVSNIQLKSTVVEELKTITPTSFIGNAPTLAEIGNKRLVSFMDKFDKKIALTTRSRVNAVLFDFDNTLQLGDKEELKQRLSFINKDLGLQISEQDMQELYKLSCFREMKTKMVELGSNNNTHTTEENIQISNNKVTGNFDKAFYLDEGSKELLELLNKNKIPVGIISTRGSQSLLRLINDVHEIGSNVDLVLSRDDVTERKPSPEGINIALERLDIGTEGVSYVGDKFKEDVYAAQESGVTPLYIERNNEGLSIEEKGKVLTFKNIKELYNYLYTKLI